MRISENRKNQSIFETFFLKMENYASANHESLCDARVFRRTKPVVNDVNDARHLLPHLNAFFYAFHIIHSKQL